MHSYNESITEDDTYPNECITEDDSCSCGCDDSAEPESSSDSVNKPN